MLSLIARCWLSLTAASIDPIDDRPRETLRNIAGLPFAVAMLAEGGVVQSGLWDDWAKHAALDYFGLDALPIIGSMHSYASPPAELIPEAFSVVKDPFMCKWGKLNMCELKVINETLTTFPTAKHIAFVSGTSIPVTTYRAMADRLSRYPGKSQIKVAVLGKTRGRCVKHSQWMVLARSHAEYLIEDQESWTNASWSSRAHGKAAPDEWAPICNMYRGIPNFRHEIISFYQKYQALWPPVPSYRHIGHLDCWTNCDLIGNTESGHSPAIFYSIHQRVLDTLISTPSSWFMRKVRFNTTVSYIEGSHTMEEPLREYLNRTLFRFN